MTKTEYKIMFSDLDETLLTGQHVPDFNREAVKAAEEHGCRFVIATGRVYYMVDEILKELGAYHQPDHYAVCMNGGWIVNCENDGLLYFRGLERALAQRVFDMVSALGNCIMIFTDRKCHMYHKDDYEYDRKVEQACALALHDTDEFELTGDEQVGKFLVVERDLEKMHAIGDKVKDTFGDVLDITYSSDRYVEIVAKGVSKGQGITWLCDHLNIPVDDAIAIGDNYNDVDMIQAAGLGCCVASSHDEIKARADYVCTKDYDEGAVREVIDTFVLHC